MFYDSVKRHVRRERGPGQRLISFGLVTRHPHSVPEPGDEPIGNGCVLSAACRALRRVMVDPTDDIIH